jgi:sigma-B regulation protein RsbU (phosphoserine phosphatase)
MSEKKPPSILVVDDDELVLSSLRGLFALQTDYELREAADAKEGLLEVERAPFDVVISDFLMPGMNGIDFLKEVRRLQPEAVSLLLTGYADKENAIRAINEVGIYHYLEKPWDNDELLNTVRNALERKSLRQQLAQKVSALDKLLREHSDLANRHHSLQKELEMAARVQQSLLPARPPALEGYRFANLYRPSAAVGGDFYDFMPNGANGVILVADVIGHGLQAALTTMLLKGLFHEAAARTANPVEVLADMNTRLHRILPEGMYAAASVVSLSKANPRLAFSNAGLPYPFVLRAAEKRVDEIALAGAPLGLFEGPLAQYETRALELGPGDVMLLGSDGLGTIAAPSGEIFEDRRLRQVLSESTGLDGGEVIQGLMDQALAFGTSPSLPDDVNLVAITRI